MFQLLFWAVSFALPSNLSKGENNVVILSKMKTQLSEQWFWCFYQHDYIYFSSLTLRGRSHYPNFTHQQTDSRSKITFYVHVDTLISGREGNIESLQTRMKVRGGGTILCINPAGASPDYTVEWPATAFMNCSALWSIWKCIGPLIQRKSTQRLWVNLEGTFSYAKIELYRVL